MTNALLEYTHGVIRVYDQASEDAAVKEGFYAVLNVQKVGPGNVLLSADLSRKRLTKTEIRAIKECLKAAGFKRAYAWRHKGRRVPYGGHIINECEHLALWEVEL